MKLQHLAIIMDGNGRWAKARLQVRTAGHKQGLETAKAIVKAAADRGIKYITLYVFSSENWKRTENEVGFLMGLIEKHLLAEFSFYKTNNIRVRHIGDLAGLPANVQSAIKTATAETAHYTGTTVVLAINYGGQDEIIRAAKKSMRAVLEQVSEEPEFSQGACVDGRSADGKSAKAIIKAATEKAYGYFSSSVFEHYLDTQDLPPVDLLIRTGGEKRISNFLLYQAAYAELYFSDKFWPDWTAADLDTAIHEYETRDRRFGKA